MNKRLTELREPRTPEPAMLSNQPLTSTPRGAMAVAPPLPRGFFSHAVARPVAEETAMNAIPASEAGSVTARAIVVVVALYLALAVGAPWLLHDAPPSAEDVIATRACCSTVVGASLVKATAAITPVSAKSAPAR